MKTVLCISLLLVSSVVQSRWVFIEDDQAQSDLLKKRIMNPQEIMSIGNVCGRSLDACLSDSDCCTDERHNGVPVTYE